LCIIVVVVVVVVVVIIIIIIIIIIDCIRYDITCQICVDYMFETWMCCVRSEVCYSYQVLKAQKLF